MFAPVVGGESGDKKEFEFDPWMVHTMKSHILESQCSFSCEKKDQSQSTNHICALCRYEQELELPQLPEMTFAFNVLKLHHNSGFSLEFNTLDALRMVDSKNDIMKVAVAEAWQESRMSNSQIKEVIKPFDWTFTTHYKGTLSGKTEFLKVSQTDERIDIEKLKAREKILFYEDVVLFEDELADNGTAQCSVKMRVMPISFFILLRFFLRVDNLLVRIIDTRIYHEVGKKYLLREHVTKEEKISNLKVGLPLLTNPQELWDHLPTVSFEYEKLEFC